MQLNSKCIYGPHNRCEASLPHTTMQYDSYLEILTQDLPEYRALEAAVKPLKAAIKFITREEDKDDVLPPLDVLKQAMTVYAAETDGDCTWRMHRWESLGLIMSDYPRLMTVAAGSYAGVLQQLAPWAPPFTDFQPWVSESRKAVVHLMKRGLRLPPNHGTGLEWIETILVILGGLGKAPSTPLSRFPRDLVRMLAGFIRERV